MMYPYVRFSQPTLASKIRRAIRGVPRKLYDNRYRIAEAAQPMVDDMLDNFPTKLAAATLVKNTPVTDRHIDLMTDAFLVRTNGNNIISRRQFLKGIKERMRDHAITEVTGAATKRLGM
jgi:hypothetical protein